MIKKKTLERYCDLAGFDSDSARNVLFAKDGSELTLIRVHGVTSIASDFEFRDRIVDRIENNIGPAFRGPGHALTISFESSQTVDEEIRSYVRPQEENAAAKSLEVRAILEENAEFVRRRARFERVLVACWTRRSAGYPASIDKDDATNRKLMEQLPPMRLAQSPYLSLDSLEALHEAFVERVKAALRQASIAFEVLGPGDNGERHDLAEIRKALFYYETPASWTALPAGSVKYPLAKEKKDSDVSTFFAPSVASQMMTSNAVASNGYRDVALGSRKFAPLIMRMLPARLLPFRELLRSMLISQKAQRTPFRVAIHIEGWQRGVMHKLREIVATTAGQRWLAKSGADNERLARNLRFIDSQMKRQTGAMVRTTMIGTTWVEPGEAETLLSDRRAQLFQAMSAWGDGIASDSPRDPLEVVTGSIAGMRASERAARAAIAPIGDIASLLPFNSVAPAFRRGESLFLSPDNRVIPHEAFSHQQQFWLSIINARPGSGKSVLMNRLNFEFASFARGARLPFIGIIDVGVSSLGFIEIMRQALPEDQGHLVVGSRLQKQAAFAVNFFDTGLGNRSPLDLETTFISNFLLTMADTADEKFITQFRLMVPRIIKKVFNLKNDLAMSSSPNKYAPDEEKEVDQAVEALKVPVTESTTWWRLCDFFMERDMKTLAYRCHVQAMPRLPDVTRVLAEKEMRDDFGEDLIRLSKRALENAAEKFPTFGYATKLNFGPARIVAIDLNDVLEFYEGPEARRNNTLWYMTALHALIGKISGSQLDIPAMEFPADKREIYERHWRAHFQDVEETPKRAAIDEYHNTGGLATISHVIDKYVRQGRKWNLEMIVASQRMEDFGVLKSLASTVILMNAETEEERRKLQDTFGFSDAVREEMRSYLHGPRDGARFLVNYKLMEDERWMILGNVMGGRLLWALTTKAEDRAVRDEIYRGLGVSDTLALLGERFPTGTALEFFNEVKRHVSAGESIARAVADELVRDWIGVRTTRRRGEGLAAGNDVARSQSNSSGNKLELVNYAGDAA